MWTRKELKDKGKAAFKRNYWICVLAAFIQMVLIGMSGSTSKSESIKSSIKKIMLNINSIADQIGVSEDVIIGILVCIFSIAFMIVFVINIFAKNPLLLGSDRFFLVNTRKPATIKEIIYSFTSGRYFTIVGTMFLKELFITLWTMLLIVPGIIKAYEYRMVDYILADEPELGVMDTLRRSKEMMQGQKWNAFVLDLSFIGWQFLDAITLGIVGIFYVNPYVQATNAELYLTLKK